MRGGMRMVLKLTGERPFSNYLGFSWDFLAKKDKSE
jgi:hypothetical protein